MPRQPRRRRARLDARAAPRAARRRHRAASRRSPSRSSSRRTTASCPASSCSRRPTRSRASPTSWSPSTAGRSPASAISSRRPRRRASSIVIDHHVSNQRYGTINVIDPDAAASGVLVRRLIDASSACRSTRDAAVCLYAALVCDTGRFQYETTTPAVFELARRARRASTCRSRELSRTLFEEHRFAYLQLLAEALAARRARRREAVRVDEGDPGRPRAPRRDVRRGRGPHRHRAPHPRGRGRVRAEGGARRRRGASACARSATVDVRRIAERPGRRRPPLRGRLHERRAAPRSSSRSILAAL